MESDKLGILSAALRVVCNDLEVVRSEETSSLVAHAIEIMDRVCQLRRSTTKLFDSVTMPTKSATTRSKRLAPSRPSSKGR